MERSVRFVDQESIKGWYTMGTREFMPSNFRLLPSLMALLDNCLDLWVRIRNEGFLFLIDSSSLVNFPYKLTSLSSEGKRHDAAMLADSNLLTALEQYVVSPTGQEMCIYGDPAYPLRVNLMAPFRGAALTAQMEAFNKSMSNVRTSVEWLFGDIVEYFKFMDFKKNLKIGLSSIGKLYVVCALLRNALTCLYGNSTSSYFKLDPPTLEEYFA